MKGLFTPKDYYRENKKTRPRAIPKKQPVKKCRLCPNDGLFIVREQSNLGFQEFLLCREHYEQHERKKMKFKPIFEKAEYI